MHGITNPQDDGACDTVYNLLSGHTTAGVVYGYIAYLHSVLYYSCALFVSTPILSLVLLSVIEFIHHSNFIIALHSSRATNPSSNHNALSRLIRQASSFYRVSYPISHVLRRPSPVPANPAAPHPAPCPCPCIHSTSVL